MGRWFHTPRVVCQFSLRWYSASSTPITSHRQTAATPKNLMSIVGSGITLKVRLIPPMWGDTETGRVTRVRAGGLLFDFVPQNVAGSRGPEDWIRFSPTVTECGKILLMNRTVGLQLVHNHVKPSGGRETKAVEWTPATSDCEMELKLRHSDDALGSEKGFRLPFPEARLVLLQELLERCLPTITGFGRLAPMNHAGSTVDDLIFYKKTAGLHVGFAGPSLDATGPDGLPVGDIAKEGRLFLKFVPRSLGRDKNGPTFDWVNSVTFVLRADDCAEFITMGPGMRGNFVRSPASFRDSGKTMTWYPDPDGNGVVAAASGKGRSMQVPLSWAELKVIQVVARSLVPRMLGLSWLCGPLSRPGGH
eukprot:EG_transcript_16462